MLDLMQLFGRAIKKIWPVMFFSVCAFTQNQLTEEQAVAEAMKNAPQLASARLAAEIAGLDAKQAKVAGLPSASVLNQYIYTEGNGTPSGVFVANDGVHVYNEQLQAHEDVFALIRRGEIHAAEAAAAVARAKADVAARGVKQTAIADFYTVVSAQRHLGNTEKNLKDAQDFVAITQKLEQGGEAAHADVLRAQLAEQQRERDNSDAQAALRKAKIDLSILISPDLNLAFTAQDDLETTKPLDDFRNLSGENNPDLKATQAAMLQARTDVTVARYAYLPSFTLDVFYGLDANQLAIRSNETAGSNRSTLPNYLVPYRQNLGYSAQATLTIPVWNWGATHDKVKQAELRAQQARLDLTATERQLKGQIAEAYSEAETAQQQISSLKSTVGLAEESLRLTLLRYQAGEATVLEVVDAQTTAAQARDGYDAGLLRYRTARATLEALAGK